MLSYRITKYNPKNRNKNGDYQINEWTSFSDIGKNLSRDSYFEIENKYISTILKIINILGVDELKITNHEEGLSYNEIDNGLIDEKIYKKISNNINFNINEIGTVIRSILREYFWGKLVGKNNFFIHFGYDFYIYIGFDGNDKIRKIINNIYESGIYIEEFKSPYL